MSNIYCPRCKCFLDEGELTFGGKCGVCGGDITYKEKINRKKKLKNMVDRKIRKNVWSSIPKEELADILDALIEATVLD